MLVSRKYLLVPTYLDGYTELYEQLVPIPLNCFRAHVCKVGQNGGRYQQVDMTMTPPPANRLLNHHGGSLSSADSSILYNTSSHPTSPLLSQRSPMHQKRHPQPQQSQQPQACLDIDEKVTLSCAFI